MGRRRTFIESEAISSATATFAERGFAGASVDDLVRAALSPAATPGDSTGAARAGREELDLILVALMEIAPGDPAVREALEVALNRAGITAEALGRRLLVRAGATTSGSAASAPTASASPPT